MVKQPHSKERISEIETASGADTPPVLVDRVGIERAFDVIRNHTVHTKGYVITALKLIEEFGSAEDKSLLADLMRQSGRSPVEAISKGPVAKKKPAKRK